MEITFPQNFKAQLFHLSFNLKLFSGTGVSDLKVNDFASRVAILIVWKFWRVY